MPIKRKGAAKSKPATLLADTARRITPFLMFKEGAAEAAKFYVSVFKNSRILSSTPMSASFVLDGQTFHAYNGGPHFSFSEGVSLFVSCKTQKEVDYYYDALRADGGAESMCGWLKDKYGVSWQIVPDVLMQLLSDPDRAKADRAMKAMLQMKKLDIAALKAAAKG
jgi:predicted 3-demethylubiquinone-9 3-methyltransferase (glyoxalase superfamily)